MSQHTPAEFIADRLKRTQFVVEADSFAYSTLWERHAAQHKAGPADRIKVDWKEFLDGSGQMVGCVAEHPVYASLRFVELDGVMVLMYHDTSMVVSHELIRSWLDEYVPAMKVSKQAGHRQPHCDAGNFHLCLHAIADMKKAASVEAHA